jgi:hypothetical protein
MQPTAEVNVFRLDVNLGAHGIFGQVVDSGGKSLSHMPVVAGNQNTREPVVDVVTDESGSFAFDGLEPGVYSLHAYDGDRESQIETVTVREGDRIQDVRLVVKSNSRVSIHVSTPAGPAIGARSWLLPTNRNASVFVAEVTDIEGKATFWFRPNEPNGDVVVSAPALPFTLFNTLLHADQVIEVPLSAQGSKLILRWPMSATAGQPMPVLMHRGAVLPVLLVDQWSTSTTRSRDGATAILTINSIDPGEYALCGASTLPEQRGQSCVSGVALPGEAITLSLTSPQ